MTLINSFAFGENEEHVLLMIEETRLSFSEHNINARITTKKDKAFYLEFTAYDVLWVLGDLTGSQVKKIINKPLYIGRIVNGELQASEVTITNKR